MEVKPGYKQTEVGVIPEDWGVIEAFDLDPFITSGSRGWAKYYSDRGALFVRITNLSRESIYPDLSNQKFVELPKTETEGLRTALQDGHILISITADIGIIGYVNPSIPKPAYINQHIACLRLPPEKADGLFQSYYLASHGSQKRFAEITDVGAKTGINLTAVGKLKLLRPPLPEQHAIAAALRDADALLDRLDRLVAKKRDLKQATMQQLLTGQTRLPGFHGEWKVAPYGDVFRKLNAKEHQVQTSEYDSTGTFPVVDQGQKPIVGFSDREDKCFHCPKEGVVIFGDHTCIVEFVDFDFVVGADGTQILAAKAGQCARFHAFALQHRGIPTTGYNRHFKFLKERLFASPPLAEQTTIAEVLSDMDAELATLEQRRDKTRVLKQGMMQELLTGKTRLV